MSENGQPISGSFWFYAPNKGAPVFFAIAFFASGVWQVWQGYHYKCWRVSWTYALCAAIFTCGFIAREVGAFDYESLVAYIISVCLVYAAPPLYEAANYGILGRVLFYVPWLSPMHPGRVWSTFSSLAFLVECISGIGASYSSNPSLPQSSQDAGKALMKAALILQVVIVNLFLLLAVTFHRRCLKAGIHNKNINGVLLTLYISTGLIEARTLYRVVEYYGAANIHYSTGMDANDFPPEVRYEWFFYVFEASLMVCNAYLWNIRHPRKYLPKSTKVYLDQDGVTEVTGPGYKDIRSRLARFVDPVDLAGLFRGRDKQNRFWEKIQTETVVMGDLRQSSDHQTV
ncbi:Protein RTM1 [Cytospora mali]|uniref:Protein RTM1 n=1 Tax=Cytospora mali TaxID=578113 RepID=A0A194W714_CYTMA|nr:Protein RTM1 [Valsa mali]